MRTLETIEQAIVPDSKMDRPGEDGVADPGIATVGRGADSEKSDQEKSSGGRRKIATPLLLLIGLIAVVGYVVGQNGPALTDGQSANVVDESLTNQLQLQTVGVMEIAPASTAYMPHRYTGTIVPRRTSQLSFQAAERIVEVFVDEGDTVVKGQILARQDATSLDAVTQAAAARLNQAQATLDELVKGPRQETIDAAAADLEQLRAQVDLASVTLARQRSLRRSRAGSEQEYDAARFDRAALNASVDAAAHRLAELQAGTRPEQIAAQKASVDVARAALNEAQIRLSQTALMAPFSGSVSRRLVDEGNLVQPATVVLEVIESNALEVHFGASVKIAAVLSAGDVVPFTAGGQQYEGKIAQISPMLDTLTRTREIVANVSVADAQSVVAGQTVGVEFALPSDQPGFWVPSEALLPQVRGLWSTMVLKDVVTNDEDGLPTAIVTRRDVELLSTWGTWSRVRGTITAGDQVVVQGAGRLASDQTVNFKTVTAQMPWIGPSAKLLQADAGATSIGRLPDSSHQSEAVH